MSGNGPDAAFRAALADGRFVIQRCAPCGQHIYHPRVLCPHCGSDRLDEVEPTGRGTVYSVTVVRRLPDKGGDYNVALIDLEEGPRVMSRVDGIAPHEVGVGMAVRAYGGEVADAPNVLFKPA